MSLENPKTCLLLSTVLAEQTAGEAGEGARQARQLLLMSLLKNPGYKEI